MMRLQFLTIFILCSLGCTNKFKSYSQSSSNGTLDLSEFTVSSSGLNVSISPSAPQKVKTGAKVTFTVTANSGYTLSNQVSGTCPIGSFAGSTYTTDSIGENCTVTFSANSTTASGWQHLWIGGGGFIDGLSTPPGTGVRLARTDAGGAYLWSAGKWQQLITSAIFPASDVGVNGHGLAVEEIAGCNNDPTCAYIYYGGYMFVSKNINTTNPDGITFCRNSGNLPQQTADPANMFSTRGGGPTFAVDPNNKDHVILGTTVNGLYETFNGTSCNPTWTQISTALVPLSGKSGYRVAFDPSVKTTCKSGSGQCSKKAFVWTSGAPAGVYITNDGGVSWALTSSGPSTVIRMKVSYATAGLGNLWVVDGSGALWRYTTAWLKMATPGNCCTSLAINPNDGDQVVGIAGSLRIWVSTNASSSSPTFLSYSANYAGGDAPWNAVMQLIRGASTGDIDFDPKNNGTMFGVSGQALWVSPIPVSGTTFTWTAQVNGIEELLLTGRSEVSAPGVITYGAQDQGSCRLSVPYNLTNNASDCGPLSNLGFLRYASGLSQTPDHSLMFAKVSANFNGGFDYSGTSTDGFFSNYKPLSKWSETVPKASFTNNGSGLVRATVASTSGLTSWVNGTGSILCGISKDLSWQNPLATRCFPVTVVGPNTVDLIGSNWSSGVGNQDTMLFKPATALISWAGSLTITNIADNAGAVRVTTVNTVIFNGALVCISGVQMSGATKVNGCWIAKNASGKSFDLGPTSSFVGGDTYVAGGEATTWGAPGGNIAAASATNYTIYGTNRTFPMCTNDGGATYSQVNAPTGMFAVTTVAGGPYPAGTNQFNVVDGTKVTAYQIYIRLTSGRLITSSSYSVSGNTVTLNGLQVPPGDSIPNGAAIAETTGWPGAAYFNTKMIATDQVTPNTFYGVNTDFGLLKWTHCNPPTLVSNSGRNGGFLQWTFHGLLRAVPGEAGHLFYTAGPQGGGKVATGTGLWRTCNGVNNAPGSVTMERVPGFFSPHAVGFGHAAPTQSYPSIVVAGWYSADNNINNAVYGIWRSIDDHSHGSTTNCSGGTWQNLTAGSPLLNGWPVLPITDVVGDPFAFGPVYVGAQIGAWYGNFQ